MPSRSWCLDESLVHHWRSHLLFGPCADRSLSDVVGQQLEFSGLSLLATERRRTPTSAHDLLDRVVAVGCQAAIPGSSGSMPCATSNPTSSLLGASLLTGSAGGGTSDSSRLGQRPWRLRLEIRHRYSAAPQSTLTINQNEGRASRRRSCARQGVRASVGGQAGLSRLLTTTFRVCDVAEQGE